VFRTRIANELVETEQHYLRDIRTVYQVMILCMYALTLYLKFVKEFQLGSSDMLTQDETRILFMNIKDIVAVRITTNNINITA
jgi:RhoGEF domain